MRSIIEELYYGKLCPEEHIVPTDSEYRSLNKKTSKLMEEARERLSEKDFATLEQILDLTSDSNSMVTSASFVEGFRMGALVIVEVFCGEGKIVRG
ncbi:hypothetical protein M3201_23080 [Paenibacillus motobuensis]|uniref:DUF6809 family protein n=1 Tax=Paenibacillus TaxID=44249 RepID=UPI002040D9C7|nr:MULTISPECIES: DUF6809 family protein [Paenibacillus]MCM3042544.1 hypothetical protein [Paenibacillus lutimineralis]MCM3649648.1 hypothetical protein [Paenibacillus motobuensis]